MTATQAYSFQAILKDIGNEKSPIARLELIYKLRVELDNLEKKAIRDKNKIIDKIQ